MSGQRGPTGCHRVTPISRLPVIRTLKIGPDGEPPAGSRDVLPRDYGSVAQSRPPIRGQ
jgi:hypothetical protein